MVKNGRIDHSAGGHDDRVIGWLLSVWMLGFSKNLSFYGIETPLVEAIDYKRLDEKKQTTPYGEYKNVQQQNIKKEITNLLLQLKDVKEEITAIFMEDKIRKLNNKLRDEDALPMTIDSLIQEATSMRTRLIEDAKRGTPISRGYQLNSSR